MLIKQDGTVFCLFDPARLMPSLTPFICIQNGRRCSSVAGLEALVPQPLELSPSLVALAFNLLALPAPAPCGHNENLPLPGRHAFHHG